MYARITSHSALLRNRNTIPPRAMQAGLSIQDSPRYSIDGQERCRAANRAESAPSCKTYAAEETAVPGNLAGGQFRAIQKMLMKFASVLVGIEELADFLFGLLIMGSGGEVQRMARSFDGSCGIPGLVEGLGKADLDAQIIGTTEF